MALTPSLFDESTSGTGAAAEIPAAKLTPMMTQYQSIKKTLPSDTILFFRLGDFYEMFFEDAVRGSEILNITLTGREGGEAGRIPMCGFPYHAFQGYVRTLIDHNLKVAICEQVGDPKAAKGLVERKIDRIISPATYLEEEAKSADSEFMLALSVLNPKKPDLCGVAYLELSTGEFYVREMGWDRIYSDLSLLTPREVILSKSLAADTKLMSFIKEVLRASVTTYDDWIFDPSEGLRFLKDGFKLASEKSLSFHDRPLSIASAGAILYYLRDHLHQALGHLRPPIYQETKAFMILDHQAQKSLELVQSMSGNKESGNLLSCLDQTKTCMGARTLHHWVIRPLIELKEIQNRQAAITEFMARSEELYAIQQYLKGIRDMERTLSRLNVGVANARDLLNLRLFLERVPELKEKLTSFKSEMIQKVFAVLNPFPQIQDLLSKSIVEEPPLGLRDGGIIRPGYAPELDELRNVSKNGKSWILDFEKKEIERTGIKSLKVKYSNVFGYTIEISKSNLHAVPADYIRRQTLANAERFIVPELKTWDEKISGAEEKIKALEYRLFLEIREKVLAHLLALQEMAKEVGILDALCSLALIALQKGWIKPEVIENRELTIVGGRHPVVEAMLAQGQFVENDTYLDGDQNQLIVLTGPNMAGKSTFIRQVALIVLLAQMGSYVPASRARVGLVDRIFTRIGSSDDLAHGESTFMVEMVEMAQILQNASERSLLILDEVGRGTSTFDGVSIAWAICEHLVKAERKPRTLFATHYHELTQLEEHFPAVKNYKVMVKESKDGIVFLRKVARGGSERSYGIHVARLAGIPESVTHRAREILKILESESQEATCIIETGSKPKGVKQKALIEVPAQPHPVLDEMKNCDLDDMTPRQALNQLADWKRKLQEEED